MWSCVFKHRINWHIVLLQSGNLLEFELHTSYQKLIYLYKARGNYQEGNKKDLVCQDCNSSWIIRDKEQCQDKSGFRSLEYLLCVCVYVKCVPSLSHLNFSRQFSFCWCCPWPDWWAYYFEFFIRDVWNYSILILRVAYAYDLVYKSRKFYFYISCHWNHKR